MSRSSFDENNIFCLSRSLDWGQLTIAKESSDNRMKILHKEQQRD